MPHPPRFHCKPTAIACDLGIPAYLLHPFVLIKLSYPQRSPTTLLFEAAGSSMHRSALRRSRTAVLVTPFSTISLTASVRQAAPTKASCTHQLMLSSLGNVCKVTLGTMLAGRFNFHLGTFDSPVLLIARSRA